MSQLDHHSSPVAQASLGEMISSAGNNVLFDSLSSKDDILALKRHSNGLSALGRLPPEILVKIFLFTQDGPYSDINRPRLEDSSDLNVYELDPFDIKWGPERDHTWVSLMSSCNLLREVALTTPELWQYVNVPRDSSRWTKLCADRNGGKPITLVLQPIYIAIKGQCITNYGAITEQLPRARQARLLYNTPALQLTEESDAHADARGVSDNLLQVCEHLETLSVSISQAWEKRYLGLPRMNRVDINLTNKFLGGSSTTLTTLILNGIRRIIAPGPQFPNLRNLKVSLDNWDVLFGELIVWLSTGQSPILKSLYLVCKAYTPRQEYTGARPGNLPSLHYLGIEGPIDVTENILGIVPEPTKALSINVTMGRERGHEDEGRYASLREWVHKYYTSHTPVEPCALDSRIQIALEIWSPSVSSIRVVYESRLSNRLNHLAPFCQFSVPRAYVSRSERIAILTLHIIADQHDQYRDQRSFLDITTINTMELGLVHTVILERVRLVSDIDELVQWMKQRRTDGYPIRALQICKPVTEDAKHHLIALIPILTGEEVVEVVEWM